MSIRSVSPHTIVFSDDEDVEIPRRSRSDRQSLASIMSSSTASSGARSDASARRRGFMRPQGTEFSTSARSRDSVMALGSIAHLQYFFAKTGLLDGKGAGFMTEEQSEELQLGRRRRSSNEDFDDDDHDSDDEHDFYMEHPHLMFDDLDFEDLAMLPPTTSTYNPRPHAIPPPPDPDVLRDQLRQSLAVTKVTWEKAGAIDEEASDNGETEGLQGRELVDLGNAAVRAAKSYYYTTDISLLTTKDERTLREEFLAIREVLKQMEDRNFEGGVRHDERQAVLVWITGVENALDEEEQAIADIRSKDREWLEGSWEGREHELHHQFLSYFDTSSEPLPPNAPVEEDTPLPTAFLAALQTGLKLINIHNAVVRRSRRPFGQIHTFHTEFSKPYRLAENLKFWKKAAEIRWELKLKFDVMSVVNGTNQGWLDFNRDIAIWCRTVLNEVRKDWEMGQGAAAVGTGRNRSATMNSMRSDISTRNRPGRSPTTVSMRVNLGDRR